MIALCPNLVYTKGDSISKIIFFTTPKDVCRSTLVSSAFKETTDADAAWDRLRINSFSSFFVLSWNLILITPKE
ncbi:F-box protein PP2-B10-like [Senna tora]|uniref:F-box protein PP2-B10-like n=1 Tax=Senna tora TaxID=362788 RepID=A0A834TTQ8_9FABA|nr:F-box protein PP2-B10-like [Senna tora]